jgi:hypothetical protein
MSKDTKYAKLCVVSAPLGQFRVKKSGMGRAPLTISRGGWAMGEKTDWTQDTEAEEHFSLAPASIVPGGPEGIDEMK